MPYSATIREKNIAQFLDNHEIYTVDAKDALEQQINLIGRSQTNINGPCSPLMEQLEKRRLACISTSFLAKRQLSKNYAVTSISILQ